MCSRSKPPKAPTQMLARVAELRASGRVARTGGDRRAGEGAEAGAGPRFDLPSIGPRPSRSCARRAGRHRGRRRQHNRVAEPERLVSAADRAKIFVVGVPAGTER